MTYTFNVTEKLNGNVLHIDTSIVPELNNDANNGRYSYRLRNDFEIVEEIKNVTNISWDFVLPNYGQYFVQVSYSNGKTHLYKSSKLVLFSRSCPEEYQKFLNSENTVNFADLPYFEPDYPHQDFCLFRLTDQKKHSDSIENLMRSKNMYSNIYSIDGKTICRLLTSSPVQNIQGKIVAFSGVTRTTNQLIVGDNDLVKNNIDPETLKNEIGDFWMIYQDGENVHLIHDYLGLSKFYYYQNGDDFIISNRYHLLLLALKSLKISPKPRIDRIIADLSSVNAFARLNYSRNMQFENTYVVTSDKYIAISDSKISFINNDLHEELFNPAPYDENTYKTLVKKGAQEMLDNMEIALKYSPTNKFKIDLSGGLDSRMIFALITNFPEYRERVHIHALDLPNYPKDLSIALELNSIYNYPYFTLPITTKPILKKDSHKNLLSGYLGINQQPMPVATASSYQEKMLDMPGLLGEMVFRPHMYTKFKVTPEEDTISVADFINKRVYYNIEGISEKGHEYFSNLFINEIDKMPGDTPAQKFQNHYIMFMDTIHHSTYYSSSENHTFQWMPLLSKTIFHLNNITGIVFRSNKLAYDLMNVINPVLAAIPYEKDLYNKELTELAKQDSHYAHTFKVTDECIEFQRKKWKAAQIEKTNVATFETLADDEKAKIDKANTKFFDELKAESLEALRKIIKYNNNIGDTIGLECFSRMCCNDELKNNEKWLKFLYNKIMTVYYELRIFGYVD